MKRTTTGIAALMIMLFIAATAGAQGKYHRDRDDERRGGYGRKGYHRHDGEKRREKEHDDHDHDDDHKRHHHHDCHGHYRVDRHVHDHCHGVVTIHRTFAPRYVYYRDYDVYFDYHENVYITYSGHGWTVSASLPRVLRHVNMAQAVHIDVDYRDDNFHHYLDRRRPAYRRVYTGG